MQLSDKSIQEFKEIYEKESGKEITLEQAREYGTNLVEFMKILLDGDQRERMRKKKLEEFPKGYHLPESEGIFNCRICYTHVSGSTSWYDKWGVKCLLCQKAIDTHAIPGSICTRDYNWYSLSDFETYYDLKHQTVRKFVRQGKLKARIVLTEGKKPYYYVFLVKDNKGVLVNKPKSVLVRNEDGSYSSRWPRMTLTI